MFARFSMIRTLAVLTLPFFLVPGASAADPPPKATPKSPQAAWQAAKPVLDRFIEIVFASCEAEIKRLEKELFSGPLAKVVPFADQTLGRKAELSLDAFGEGFGLFQDAINAVLGADTVNANATRTDVFGNGVRRDLRRDLQPYESLARIREAAGRLGKRIREEEARVLVELGIDAELPRIPIYHKSDFPPIVEKEIHRFERTAHEIVSGDLMMSMGRIGVAAVLGDKLADQVVDENADFFSKNLTKLMIDEKVNAALVGLLNKSGYDPKSLIAKAYVAMIERLRFRLLNGSEDGLVFDLASSLERSHYDPEVRREAKLTIDVLERNSDIGMTRLMQRFCRSTIYRLKDTVYRHRTGFDKPELLYVGPDPAKLPPAAKLIEEFRAARRRWEAAK